MRARPAAGVRRAEGGRPVDRRRPDPEPRDDRRQPVQRLAGCRRAAQPDRARRAGRAGSSAAGRRELAVGEFVIGNRRTVRRAGRARHGRPGAASRRRRPGRPSCKLGSRAYLVISIAMVAVVLDVGRGRPGRDGTDRGRRLLRGAAADRERSRTRLVGQRASPALATRYRRRPTSPACRRSTTSAARRPTAATRP